MAKKKAGSLSGTMIVRDRRKGGVGFVYGQRPSATEGREGAENIESSKPEEASANETMAAMQDPEPPPTDDDSRSEVVAEPSALSSDAKATILDRPPSAELGKVVALYPDRQTDEVIEEAAPDFSNLEIRNADNLVSALRSADIAEAEDIFASMTGLTHVDVLRLLYGPDGNDLALVCRALGMEQLQFVSVYILSRKLGLGEEAIDPRELARIVAFFEATDETEAVAALASWRVAEEEDTGNPVGPA